MPFMQFQDSSAHFRADDWFGCIILPIILLKAMVKYKYNYLKIAPMA